MKFIRRLFGMQVQQDVARGAIEDRSVQQVPIQPIARPIAKQWEMPNQIYNFNEYFSPENPYRFDGEQARKMLAEYFPKLSSDDLNFLTSKEAMQSHNGVTDGYRNPIIYAMDNGKIDVVLKFLDKDASTKALNFLSLAVL